MVRRAAECRTGNMDQNAETILHWLLPKKHQGVVAIPQTPSILVLGYMDLDPLYILPIRRYLVTVILGCESRACQVKVMELHPALEQNTTGIPARANRAPIKEGYRPASERQTKCVLLV
jgi:hypothetical protein